VVEEDLVVLITGATGILGKELMRTFPDALHPTHSELDICDKMRVHNFMSQNRPDVLIHAAALTGVRECEENRRLAYETNVEGTANLVNAVYECDVDCYFAYISTACVFYGDVGDYTEDDLPFPKNFYSLTKLLGEFVVRHSQLPKYIVIRTNFAARERWRHPKAFADRYGTFLFADDLASAIKSVLDTALTGIVHVCGEEKMSLLELARITTPDVAPTTLAEYEGPPLTVDMSLRSVRIAPFKIRKTI